LKNATFIAEILTAPSAEEDKAVKEPESSDPIRMCRHEGQVELRDGGVTHRAGPAGDGFAPVG